MKVLYWLRRMRTNKAGTAPVICRITVKGSTPVQFSTNLMVERWDTVRKKAKGANSQIVNVELTRIKSELEEIGRDLERKKVVFTAQTVMDTYNELALPTPKKMTWVELMQNWIDRTLQKYNVKMCKKSTYDNAKYRIKSLEEYLRAEKIDDLPIEKIKRGHYEAMQLFFLNTGKSWNYVRLILNDLHAQLVWAVDNSILDKDPWSGLSMELRVDEDAMFWLTSEQVAVLEAYNPENETKEKRRDAILFLVWSGLSWTDYDNLASDNLINDAGELWLDGKRGKTTTPFYIPVFKFTKLKELIEKYGTLEKLPKYRNQNLSNHIKEIFSELGFENAEAYSCHDMRRTFAQLCYEHFGYEDKVVATMIGHKNTTITHKHYIRVTRDSIRNRI